MSKKEIKEWFEAIIIALVVALLIRGFIVEPYIVDGDSMLPTLHDGERLIIDKISYRFSKPDAGEIIVFKYPQNMKLNYIKRVVGIPGDEIYIHDGFVYINGILNEESFIAEPTYGTYGPVIVPDNHYFVLGDNRNNSKDSRFSDVGFIPSNIIKGKPLIRIWPMDTIGLL